MNARQRNTLDQILDILPCEARNVHLVPTHCPRINKDGTGGIDHDALLVSVSFWNPRAPLGDRTTLKITINSKGASWMNGYSSPSEIADFKKKVEFGPR